MSEGFKIQDSGFKIQDSGFNWRRVVVFCFLFSVFCLLSCSIPNLEKPECSEARDAVKEFYSFHFDKGLKPSRENLQLRGRFLTDELKQNLAARTDDKTDYFTATDDYPKAFRVGRCEVSGEKETSLEVVLFWKDDARSEQREVKVEAVKQNNNWLIKSVEK